MIKHHTRLTRLARQAMRRGDAADATRWMRAAALAQPALARTEKPKPIDTESQIDPYAEERQQVMQKLENLMAQLDREIAEHEQHEALDADEANSC